MLNVVWSADRAKVLFFDETGDCILYKRLDEFTFHGTLDLDVGGSHVEINAQELARVLRGSERRGRNRIH